MLSTLALCHAAALDAWYRTAEAEKKIEAFSKVIQGLKEVLVDFLQRLASTIIRMIPDSEGTNNNLISGF